MTKTRTEHTSVGDSWFTWKQDARMKFHQRLLILAAAGVVAVVYLVFLGNASLIGLLDTDHHVSYRDSPYKVEFFSGGDKFRPVESGICTGIRQRIPSANISTLDLQLRTSYSMRSNGDYILPSASVKDTNWGEKPLTVIVVPHSHNDPGWLRTLEEYYVYTTKNILNNMVSKLRIYHNMTFVWAETVFLSMWWNELEDDMKAQVRRLVRRGQLEIVLGGWVMPDEASTHYFSVIDQLMEGHQWVTENLHVKPVNSWSIDPFGHSGAIPYLWKQAGLNNMVIQRIHQASKGALANDQNLEFYWRQFWDVNGKFDILCHVMPYMLYGTKFTCGPNHQVCRMFDFRYDENGGRKRISEVISLKNVGRQAKALYQQYRYKADLYKHNVILVPLGDDFRYDHGHEWDQQYQNYDMLMRFMNEQPDWNVNIKFGTLKDYFEVLKESEGKSNGPSFKFNTLSGDFFPYSDKNGAYWSGYFSTRPFDKSFARDVERTLRAADILNVLTYAYVKKWNMEYHHYHDAATQLQQARRNLGLFLHHDAITGTAKAYVVEDYERQLFAAFIGSQKVIRSSIQTLLSQGKMDLPLIFSLGITRPNFKSLPRRQVISILEPGTKVILFNSLVRVRTEILTFLVDTDKFVIRSSNNDIIPHQINPVWDSHTSVHANNYEVVFLKELPPLAIETVTFYRLDSAHENSFPAKITIYNTMVLGVGPHQRFYQERPRNAKNYKGSILLENEFMELKFSSETGMLENVFDKITGNATQIQLQFLQYKSQGSGAYLFYPAGEAEPTFTTSPVIHVIEGPLMSQVEVIHPHVQHVVKLYNHPAEQGRGIHIQNLVNMYAQELRDHEIIMRLNTDIHNNELSYYTDQNGFQMIKRRTNNKLRTEANYYPFTTMAILEDEVKRLTLHSGQSHGIGCLKQGQLEVMLERQLLYDDERGLGEGVEDNKLTISKFVLQIEPHSGSQNTGHHGKLLKHKHQDITFPSLMSLAISDQLQQPVIDLFTKINTDLLHAEFYPVAAAMPCDMTLVSLKNLVNKNLDYTGTSMILHRHGYQCNFPTAGLQCHLSSNTSISSLFRDFQVHGVRETTLTHMYEKSVVEVHAPFNISPMELAAFKLTL